MTSSRLFAILLASLSLTACSTFQTSDFGLFVQLPASRDCFEVRVMSGKEKRYPPEECQRLVQRGVFMTSDSWKMLKRDIQKNCQYDQCKQISGAADGLFLAIDRALQAVP